MTYTPTNWQDRIVQKPLTYTMTNNADGTITLTPAPGTVTQAGTPVNATALNNIENKLVALDASAPGAILYLYNNAWGGF
jgi:hypothetical protein